MANINTPFGLKPVRYLNSAPYNGQARKYHIKDDYSTALYIGTPVTLTGTSSSTPLGAHADVQIATLADTNYTIGPIVAFDPTYSDLSKVVSPVDTDGYCYVADDPNIIFEVQCDSVTNLTPADIGLNAILVQSHAGSAYTMLEGMELDESSAAGNSSFMCKIMNVVNRADNEMTAGGVAHTKVEIILSTHTYGWGVDGESRLGA